MVLTPIIARGHLCQLILAQPAAMASKAALSHQIYVWLKCLDQVLADDVASLFLVRTGLFVSDNSVELLMP